MKIESIESAGVVIEDIGIETFKALGKEFADIKFMTWDHSCNDQGKYKITGSVKSQQEADKVFSILSFYLPKEA